MLKWLFFKGFQGLKRAKKCVRSGAPKHTFGGLFQRPDGARIDLDQLGTLVAGIGEIALQAFVIAAVYHRGIIVIGKQRRIDFARRS